MSNIRWDDLVFTNRNRSYGAYALRKMYPNRVTIAFGVSMALVTTILASPIIKSMLLGDPISVIADKKEHPNTLDFVPPITPIITPPPPTVTHVTEQLMYVPPKVTQEEVDDVPPTIDELKVANIAPVTTEGQGVIVDDPPVVEPIEAEPDDSGKIYTTVQIQPEFIGGYAELMKFIAKNIKYPSSARRMGVEGSVFISFVVNEDGTINSVQALKGIQVDCDNEALRLIGKMPSWKPGKQNGKAVKVRFVLPIKFKLAN